MFTFYILLLYNYNGESMKRNNSLVCSVTKFDDIKKINRNTQYINLFLDKANGELFAYFIENGKKYSYAESFSELNGYIYVDYDTFIKGEMKVKSIIEGIPSNLSQLEKLRYIYIELGKTMSYDINVILEKNDNFIFNNLGNINNLWGSLSTGKITNISIVKIFKYLCVLSNIDCEIVSTSDYGYLCNKVVINDQVMLLDLMKDIPYIQCGFPTMYFHNYNDDIELDKKIGYVHNIYNNEIIESEIKKYIKNGNCNLEKILFIIQQVLNVDNIRPIELGIILDSIFSKYFPNHEITINNLYINDLYGNKEHFLLITGDNKHFSYNYRKKSFVEISKQELTHNLNSKKIGIYLEEEIPDLEIYNTKSII